MTDKPPPGGALAWIARRPGSRRRHSVGALVVIGSVLAAWLLAGSLVQSQSPPLALTLSGPDTCENDAATDYLPGAVRAPEVEIEWSVSGGTPPYQVMIHGARHTGAIGRASVVCAVWSDEWRSASGDIAVAATVTDAGGRRASAVHDIYSIRSYREMGHQSAVNAAYRTHRLYGGGTYRVHGRLWTLPEDRPVHMREHLSADCASPGPDCRDRFRLEMYESSGSDHSQGYIWIYRWSGTEHSRWLDSSIGRHGVLILADDPDAVVPGYERRANEAFDRLLESRGRPPDRLVAAAAGAHSGRLSITLTMPRLCRSGSFREDNGLPVRWEVEGGAPPYDVTIGGARYLGREGLHWIKCGFEPGRALDSGVRTLQAVAVDSRGDSASDHADMVVVRRFLPGHWQVEHLTAGRTYLLGNWFGTPPAGAQVRLVAPFSEERFCPPADAGGEERLCDYDMHFEIEADGAIGTLTLGARAGDEYARALPARAPLALARAIDGFVASVGRHPRVGEDFRDASAEPRFRWLADPGECSPGGSVRVHVRATGGQWWPLSTIELGDQEVRLQNSARGDSASFWVNCGDAARPLELELRATELRFSPFERVTTVAESKVLIGARGADQDPHDNDIYTQVDLGMEHGVCVAGEPFPLEWQVRPARGQEGRISVTIDGVVGVHGGLDAVQLRCAEPPGPHRITLRVRAEFDTPQFETLDIVYESVTGRPERRPR